MPRGGARKGTLGKAYQNRTDMHGANVVSAQPVNTGAKLPVATASGQPYGAATVQKNAQQTVAMAGTQTPTPIAGAPVPQSAPSTPITPLDAPTDHGLPITHGMDGEGMIPTLKFDPTQQALSLLNSLGDNVSPQVAYVRNFLAMQSQNQMPQ